MIRKSGSFPSFLVLEMEFHTQQGTRGTTLTAMGTTIPSILRIPLQSLGIPKIQLINYSKNTLLIVVIVYFIQEFSGSLCRS